MDKRSLDSLIEGSYGLQGSGRNKFHADSSALKTKTFTARLLEWGATIISWPWPRLPWMKTASHRISAIALRWWQWSEGKKYTPKVFSALKTQVPQQAKKRFGVSRKACFQGEKELTVCKLGAFLKARLRKVHFFWRFSGGFWFSQDRLFSRNSTRKPINLIKSLIFTNTPCKSTCLYNAPSMRTFKGRKIHIHRRAFKQPIKKRGVKRFFLWGYFPPLCGWGWGWNERIS